MPLQNLHFHHPWQSSLALYLNQEFTHRIQEVIRAYGECEVADDPVVVMKSRPTKAGNRVEDKIKTTVSGDLTSLCPSKRAAKCEGVR